MKVTIKQIQNKIEELGKEKQNLLLQLEEKRKNLYFECGCGKKHKIKDCSVIQTHWYTSPSGCSGGDYWSEGELQIICPINNVKNRVMFSDTRHDREFKGIYKHLFNQVIDDYDKDSRGWWNNFYFDRNHNKFGLHVEGID